MAENKKILERVKKINIYMIIGSLILVATVSIFIDYYYYHSNLEFLNTKRISDTKENLQNINSRLKRFSQNKYKSLDEIIVASVKNQTEQGKILVESILQKYKNASISEKLERIEDALRVTKFFNGRGYYFIADKNSKMIFNSAFPETENTVLEFSDYIIDSRRLIKENDEGLFRVMMQKPGFDDSQKFLKWSYISLIENTDWYIGTGDYYFDFIEEYKNDLLNNISIIRNSSYGFFYIIDISTGSFIINNDKLVKNPVSIYLTTTEADDKIFEEAIKITQKTGEGFIDFHFSKQDQSSLENALVNIVKIPELNWLIASGVYQGGVNSYFESDRNLFRSKILTNIVTLFILICLIIIYSNYLNNKNIKILQDLFDTLKVFFKESIQTDQLMNKDKLQYEEFVEIADSVNQMVIVKKEVSDALVKDKIYIDQLMLDNPEAIALVDKDSKIMQINPAFTKIFSYKIEECKGIHIDKLLCSDKELINASNSTQKVTAGITVKFYGNRISKEGKEMNMFITGIPVIYQRKVEAIFAIYQDKTDIIEHEIALKIASDHAIEAAKTKSQFLANMSHEIRTPMNGVIGMTDLLSKTQLTNEQADFVETIKISGESLLRVINDILDFSKIESGKYNFNFTDFDLSTCIEKSMDVIALKVQEKGVKLSYSIDSSVPVYINSDFERLKQVLINLLNNAYKFTNSGFIKISVSKINSNNNKFLLKFKVTDSGIGIPQDKVNTIFDSFSQVDSSSSRSYTGTGLGLAISKAIIDNLNGKIWVESKLNIGSSFIFTLETESRIISNNDVYLNLKKNNPRIGVIANSEDFTNISTILNPIFNSVYHLADSESLHTIDKFSETWNILIIDYHIFNSFSDYLYNFIKSIKSSSLSIIFMKNIKDTTKDYNDLAENVQFLNYPIHKNKLVEKIGICFGEISPKKELDITISEEVIQELKVLVAEDNTINQKLMNRLFQKIGISVDMANDGIEALEMATSKQYDIIFMDIQMPRLDGLKATERIREALKAKAPMIVALTANVLPEDKEKCIDSGMVAFLPKPVKIADIEKILYKFIKKEIL